MKPLTLAATIALPLASAAFADEAKDDAATVAAGSAGSTISVLANDTAASAGSRLAVVAVTAPSHGKVTIAPGGTAVVYVPEPGYEGTDSFVYTATSMFQVLDLPRRALGSIAGVPVTGGFGSSLAVVPGTTDEFWLLTDRGPNVDGPEGSKIFADPAFAPQVGRFRLVEGALTAVGSPISLKNAAGKPRTGLPNPAGAGGTGEIAYDIAGKLLAADPDGIDCEGLAAAADGTFWVSDEYGPYVIHFSTDGTTLEQITPFATNAQGRKLPAVLRTRIPNKGMEGLTLTPDGKRLVGVMQAPLANGISESDAGKSPAVRIVTIDLVTDAAHTAGATRQFLYLVDEPKASCCEIAAASDTEFLVLERDGKFPANAKDPATLKRIYRVSFLGATDVTDPADLPSGLPIGSKTIEGATKKQSATDGAKTLATAGITPVAKTLVVDLLAQFGKVGALATLFPHDKYEGLAVIDGGRRLVVSNDDDFGVGAGPAPFTVAPKALPAIPGTPADSTQLLFVNLENLGRAPITATVTVTVEGSR